MPDWKTIAKLSDREAKTREAEFEAQMLALLAQGESKPSAAVAPTPPVQSRSASVPLAVVPAPSSPISARDGIQISVTNNGQTALYNNLESVPVAVRQQIINAWILSPATAPPPVLSAPAFRNAPLSPSAPRPRTMRVAMFLNLMVPGAGQFYLGQRLAGAAYALAFLASFAALLIIFVHGYFKYLNLATSGDILDSGNLEQIAHAFPAGIIAALSAIGILIYLTSTIHLAVSRARTQT
jgi:hypothetical protein